MTSPFWNQFSGFRHLEKFTFNAHLDSQCSPSTC
uniref:Uncharacterized protein n=1 Tax=Tetranychus urticae TaxID=32264 RepID=T1JZR7_TETUR